MTDKLDSATRSRVMAAVRSKGNKSTEWRLRSFLIREGISGWRVAAKDLQGKPDFVFDEKKVAVFVDGCFWHACPKHCRFPKSRTDYWHNKIHGNRKRDRRNNAKLRLQGWHVLRIWEHTVKDDPLSAIKRIRRYLD